jgi:hypothetical protein
MTMNFHDGANWNGLFDLQGRAIAAINALNTFAGTTFPDAFDGVVAYFEAATGYPLSFQTCIQGLPSALSIWQNSGQTMVGSVQTYCQNVLAGMVNNETDYQDINQQNTLVNQLEFLIAVMTTGAYYVTANAVSGVLTPGSNSGDTALAWTLKNGSGVDEQNAYAETVNFAVSANPSATTPAIAILGEPSVSNLAADWPQGSGTNMAIRATDPTASLIANGDFADAITANIPDNWIIAVGVPGTTIKITAPERQTVAISGTPTSGTYTLAWTDPNGVNWSTPTIVYNATYSAVQTALRTIPGLSKVTVTATGTTPDYTHTVVFTGVGGNISQMTATDLTVGGSHAITISTTVSGDAGDYRGSTLVMIGNSSALHTLYAPLAGLKAETVYVCHVRMKRTGTATSASMTVGIVQSIGGSVMDDPAGNDNSLVIDLSAVSDSTHESYWFTFRLPATAVSPVYLRLACTVAIPTSASIYIADVAIAKATQIYAGGPFVAAFSGTKPALEDDSWALAVSNDRAGLWQTAYGRYFGMMNSELFLPTTGTTLINNNLMA